MLKINLILTPLPLALPSTYLWTSAASYLSPWLHSYPGLSIFHRAARVLLFRSISDHATLMLRILLCLSSAWRWNLKLFLLPVEPHIRRLSYSLFSHCTPVTQTSLHFPKLTPNFPTPESLCLGSALAWKFFLQIFVCLLTPLRPLLKESCLSKIANPVTPITFSYLMFS